MLLSSGIMCVYADTAFLRKFARNNLCPPVTISRHECGQCVSNWRQKTRIAPPRSPNPCPGGGDCYCELPRILFPRTPVNKGKKEKKGRDIVAQILPSSNKHRGGLWKL